MSAKTPDGEDYNSRKTCARNRAIEAETLRGDHSDPRIFPKINVFALFCCF